ncbi:MAG: hypothetical protein ABIH34_01830 [Nanoarchaeota archaeon]
MENKLDNTNQLDDKLTHGMSPVEIQKMGTQGTYGGLNRRPMPYACSPEIDILVNPDKAIGYGKNPSPPPVEPRHPSNLKALVDAYNSERGIVSADEGPVSGLEQKLPTGGETRTPMRNPDNYVWLFTDCEELSDVVAEYHAGKTADPIRKLAEGKDLYSYDGKQITVLKKKDNAKKHGGVVPSRAPGYDAPPAEMAAQANALEGLPSYHGEDGPYAGPAAITKDYFERVILAPARQNLMNARPKSTTVMHPNHPEMAGLYGFTRPVNGEQSFNSDIPAHLVPFIWFHELRHQDHPDTPLNEYRTNQVVAWSLEDRNIMNYNVRSS